MRAGWGRVVTGALLIILGVAWTLHSAGLLDFPLRALAPVALIVIGVGLVVGARWGSYPALIAVGAVLVVVMATWNPSGRAFEGGRFGDRVLEPRSPSELRPYRVDAGQLRLDLTQLRLEARTYEIEAHARVGQVRVIVPSGVPVRIESNVAVGSIQIFGERRTSGFGASDVYESDAYDRLLPRIHLELRAGVGSIRVEAGTDTSPEPIRGPGPGRGRRSL